MGKTLSQGQVAEETGLAPYSLLLQCRSVAFHAYFCVRRAVAIDYIVAPDYIKA